MPASDIHPVVARLSRKRYGVIYRAELEERLRTAQIRTCLRTGLLEHPYTHVFVNPAVEPTPEQALAVAIGAAGAAEGRLAAAGHRSAVAAWRLVEEFPPVPEVVVPGSRRPRLDGVVVRRSLDLSRSDVVRHRRLLVPNPMLAVMQLAAVEGPTAVAEAIVRATRQRRFRPKAVEQLLWARAACGRDGLTTLRAALATLPVGERPLDSVIELWFWRIVQQHGLPELGFQVTVQVRGRRFVIDFALAEVRLAIEIDDYETHGTLCGFVHDRGRRNLLVLDGWTVLQFTWHQLRDEPAVVAAQVLQALRNLGVAA